MRIAMLGLSMLVLSGCGVVSKNIQEQSNPSQKSLSMQATEPDTPLEIYSWISGHISYHADTDSEDEFRSAEETLELGYGDCDDMAVLADDMLKKHGYSSKVITIYTASQGHTVCVWQDSKGNYNHLSSKNYREIQAPNVRAVAADVYTDWQTVVYYPDNTYEVRG